MAITPPSLLGAYTAGIALDSFVEVWKDTWSLANWALIWSSPRSLAGPEWREDPGIDPLCCDMK
jgi:hypothetical protein